MMKKTYVTLSVLPLFLSSVCLAVPSELQLDLAGKNYNNYHYQINVSDNNFILKKDEHPPLTKPIPTSDTIKNFGINDLQKTKQGFVIGTSWGGGNYFYKTQFYFKFNKAKDDFYLVKIDECALSNAIDEQKSYTTFTQKLIKQPVSLTNFDFARDYNNFYTHQPKAKKINCNAF